jgi:transketolase
MSSNEHSFSSSVEDRQRRISDVCLRARRSILKSIVAAKSGHVGGSFSCVEIMGTIAEFIGLLRTKQKSDKLIISKGHGCPTYYAILAEAGIVSRDAFETNYRKIFDCFKGHPDCDALPEIDYSSNSLGLGIGAGVGMALNYRLRRLPLRVFVVLGDGEFSEGLSQEALMYASENRLSNLVVIVDHNSIRMSRTDVSVMLEPENLGFREPLVHVQNINGHSIREIWNALSSLDENRFNLIIAKTIKGRGVRSFEGNIRYHGNPPKLEELEDALQELEKRRSENLDE